MQRNSVEIFAEIAELEKYNPYGSRDTGLWFSEQDWDNEIIPCIIEMKQKYNIPFDEIPESEQPVTDELVENKIIFFENPNELKKIDLDFHKTEITKQPTELQIKMSKSVKALNELVSYSPFRQGAELHFTPQDWRDYIYYEAVSFQRQTKSKREILLPEEIWGLIKQFLLPSTEEVEAKRISGTEEIDEYDPLDKNWFTIGDYQLDDYQELRGEITYIINGSREPVPIKNFFWISILKEGMHWKRGEKLYFRVKQNADDAFTPFTSKFESEVEWDYYIDEEGFVLSKTTRILYYRGHEEALEGEAYNSELIEPIISKVNCHYNNWWGRLTYRLQENELLNPYEEEEKQEEAEKVFSAFSLPPHKQGRRYIYRDTPSPIRDALFTKTRVLIDNEYYENVLEPWVMSYYKNAYLSKIFNNDLGEDFVEGYRIQLSSGVRTYDCLYVLDSYLNGVSIQIPVYIKDINTSSPLAMRHSVEGEDEDEYEEETLSISEIFKTLPVRTYEPLLKELFRGCTEFNCW